MKPAASSRALASSYVIPLTSGTGIGARPSDTTSVTVPPRATSAPSGGCVLITVPSGTVSLGNLEIDTTRPSCSTRAPGVDPQ